MSGTHTKTSPVHGHGVAQEAFLLLFRRILETSEYLGGLSPELKLVKMP